MSAPDRRAMVERPGKDLSVRRRCALVGVARSGVYRPKPVTRADDLAVMRRIDELHLELPFYGSRRMTFELNKEGRGVNRKRVRRLMRVMGIEALVPRPGTSKAAPGHKIYPYLLRGLKIVEPNHVWAADVTYIPMACGFLYLVAIIDWASLRLERSRHPASKGCLTGDPTGSPARCGVPQSRRGDGDRTTGRRGGARGRNSIPMRAFDWNAERSARLRPSRRRRRL